MKARLIAACLAATALSVPAVAFSAGTDKDAPRKETNTMSRDSASAPKKEGGIVSDAMITTKVKAELAKDKTVSATKINVDTDKGVVTLRGTAKSKAEAEKAVTLAKNVEGVSTVKNEVKVQAN
jgi:hyperosmotically inducible protein